MNFNLTIIGQSVTFFVFLWFCHKFVWPHIVNAMAERAKKIADGLDAADRANRDLELAQAKATDQLRKAKEEAALIIEQANRRASQIVEEAKAQGRAEGDRQVAAARAEFDQDVMRTKEDLRKQLATLVVAGAEKILEAQVNEQAHSALLEKLAAEL